MTLSKEKLEGLISRSTDIIVATDRRGRIVYYNDGASRSLGYSHDEILGSFVATVVSRCRRSQACHAGDARPRSRWQAES